MKIPDTNVKYILLFSVCKIFYVVNVVRPLKTKACGTCLKKTFSLS